MGDKSKHFRRLKELREELAALSRRSVTTLNEIAKIQLLIQELAERLQAVPPNDKPKPE